MPDKSALAAYRSKLGKVPDQQIADQAKVSRTLVVNYRKKLGIPAYQGHKAPTAAARPAEGVNRPFRGRRSALDAFVDRLGKLPDAEIARLAGVTAENVRTYRQRRNIPAEWQGASAAPGPVEVAAPAPVRARPAAPPASSGIAYVISVETDEGARTYALVAPDITAAAAEAAARIARRHPTGTIRAIQRVAELVDAF